MFHRILVLDVTWLKNDISKKKYRIYDDDDDLVFYIPPNII